MNWTMQNVTNHFLNRLMLKGVDYCRRVSITVMIFINTVRNGTTSIKRSTCTSSVRMT